MYRLTCLHAQTNKTGHSGPPPSGFRCQLACQFCVPSYVNRSLGVTSICLNEKDRQQPGLAQYTFSYHLIIVIHCVKANSTCTNEGIRANTR